MILIICFSTDSKAQVTWSSGSTIYIVANSKTTLEKRITERLVDYLSKVLGKSARVVAGIASVPPKQPAIILLANNQQILPGVSAPHQSPESFSLETGKINGHSVVAATGNTVLGLKRAVQRLIIKSEQRAPGLIIPDLHVSESPWIPKREWTVCSWSPENVRGVFSNPNADKRLNIWLYGDKQISDYVDMFDCFGFSGCQIQETVITYGTVGSAASYRDRELKFAKAVRDNGQDVSLWVWAAQFNGYGWTDPDIVYTPRSGFTAFTDPVVRSGFEKYYNFYAEMAPYVDMLITHFYDPGSLTNRADVFAYMRLLQEKFKAKNNNIKFGVDFWASDSDSAYMKQLVANGFQNVLLLESTMPSYYPPGKREALHESAKQQKLNMGVWGWHTAEIETDQNPSMHVNAQLLQHFYKQMKDGVDKIQPITYWSEMEAYHLNNIFTLYAAGQLLWNPERDPDELLKEISEGIWGPVNGAYILEALKLIQDVRTGPTWDTYWVWLPTYRLGTSDPNSDLLRAQQAILNFEKMKTDSGYVPKFPLPFPPATFVELMLPHLRQIAYFAEFRLKVAVIREEAKKGTSKAELARLAKEAWDPIPEFNTWIGTFGQLEARTQEDIMTQLGKELGIEINPPAWYRYRDANRQLQSIQNKQRQFATPFIFKANDRAVSREFLWTPEKSRDRLEILLQNGCVQKAGEDTYQLFDWKSFSRQ